MPFTSSPGRPVASGNADGGATVGDGVLLAGVAEYMFEPAELNPLPPNFAAMRALASSRSLV